MIVQCS
jgi:hypothetical protein